MMYCLCLYAGLSVLLIRGLLMYAPSRFGYASVIRFQRCICRTVMRTTGPRTHYHFLAVIAMLVCVACMSASSVQR